MLWPITSCSKCCSRDCCWGRHWSVGAWCWHIGHRVCQLSLSFATLSVHDADGTSQSRGEERGSRQLGATGGCLDLDTSNMFWIKPTQHPAMPSSSQKRATNSKHIIVIFVFLAWHIDRLHKLWILVGCVQDLCFRLSCKTPQKWVLSQTYNLTRSTQRV